MADNDINRYKRFDATTNIVEIGFGSHVNITAGQYYPAKMAAIQGFEQWQAWLQANMPEGPSKVWHTQTAPPWAKQFIWESAKI